METKIKAILLTAAVLALLLATFVGIAYFKKITSTGTVKSVGCEVFWDDALTQKVTTIEWGLVEPGKNYTKAVFIKNTSNVLANLTLGLQDWVPSQAGNYISLYWNYGGQKLRAGEVIPVTFTLAILSTITGITDFSFVIVIIASG